MQNVVTRGIEPFTIFYRTVTGEGGFTCQACNVRRHDVFPRAADVFAVATQHLNVCRGDLHHRPVEGTALLDGNIHGAVLREGIMILALNTVFDSATKAARVVS